MRTRTCRRTRSAIITIIRIRIRICLGRMDIIILIE
jgi:hypothetical protein